MTEIVTDLERIGNQAANIAHRVPELNLEPQLKAYVDLPRMAELSQTMVKESLEAFVARDTGLARRVCAEGSAVDTLNHQIFRDLLTFMMEDPRTIPRAIRLIDHGEGAPTYRGLPPPPHSLRACRTRAGTESRRTGPGPRPAHVSRLRDRRSVAGGPSEFGS